MTRDAHPSPTAVAASRPRGGFVTRVNPAAALAASALIALPLLVSLDPVSAGVALALELVLVPFAGVSASLFWRRTWPIWVAAPLTAVTIALYGRTAGVVYVDWGVIRISDGSLELALATLLRVLAIALPSVVLFLTVDPTAFADALGQILRLPSRFVLGALAGLRLVGLFLSDWRAIELARRARGVADRGRFRRFLGGAFALFVLSIRRGTKLATAMEARGFGAPGPRTWARPSRFHREDVVLIVIAMLISLAAIVAAVTTGSWNVILGPS